MKEIHFYEYEHPLVFEMENGNLAKMIYGFNETRAAIDRGEKYIHTTQMGCLNSILLLDGYRVFIHPENRDVYEVTLQTKENKGNRTVRPAQNMYGMWTGGMFTY